MKNYRLVKKTVDYGWARDTTIGKIYSMYLVNKDDEYEYYEYHDDVNDKCNIDNKILAMCFQEVPMVNEKDANIILEI